VLTTLILFPVAAALLLALTPKNNPKLTYRLNLALSLIPLMMILQAWYRFSPTESTFAVVESKEWIPLVGATYSLGLDGVNLPFLVMLTFLTVIASLMPPLAGENFKRKAVLTLVWEASLIGAFLAKDHILFLAFWAAGTIPVYFLLEPSSHKELPVGRSYVLASLISIVALGSGLLTLSASVNTAALATGGELADTITTSIDPDTQWWVFLAILIGCGLRIPIFPLHIWLRLTITQLPVSAGIMLIGGFIPVGIYALLAFALALLPDAVVAFRLVLAAAGAVNLLFGSLAALGTEDRHQKVTYHVMGYTGIALLGMATLTLSGMNGAFYTILSLGLAIAFSLTMISLADPALGLASLKVNQKRWSLILRGLETAQQLRLPGFTGFIGLFLTLKAVLRHFPTLSLAIVVALLLIAIDYARLLAKILDESREKKAATSTNTSSLTWSSPLVPVGAATILLLSGAILLGQKPELILDVLEPAINQLMPLLD